MSDDTENEAFLKTPAGLLLVKELASALKLLVFALIAKVPNLIEGKDVDLIVQLLAAVIAGGVVALWTWVQHLLMEKHVDAKLEAVAVATDTAARNNTVQTIVAKVPLTTVQVQQIAVATYTDPLKAP